MVHGGVGRDSKLEENDRIPIGLRFPASPSHPLAPFDPPLLPAQSQSRDTSN